NSAADDDPALFKRFESQRHQLAGWRKNDRSFELLGRSSFRSAGPNCSERFRKILPFPITRASESVYGAPLGHGDLSDDVCGRAEAVDSDAMRVAGFDERAIADKPSAKEGSGLGIGIESRDWETEPVICDGVFGIPAVERVTGE